MTITKFGHSCLLVQERDLRVLIDPGAYSTLQNEVKEIDDGMLKFLGPVHKLPADILTPLGIKFMVLEKGKEYEF